MATLITMLAKERSPAPKFAEGEKLMKSTKNEYPFFARFLEGQNFPEVKTSIKAGRTLKFPSDGDDDVTQKFPSDGDEEGPDR